MAQAKPIIKETPEGVFITEYEDIYEAAKAEGVATHNLYSVIYTGKLRKGFKYRFSESLPKKKEPKPANETPWEANGMFDIKGWGKACIY